MNYLKVTIFTATMMAMPLASQASALPGWAEEHAFHRCEAYSQGMGWHAASAYADARHLQRKRSFTVSYLERQQLLNTAAARRCLTPHRRAWEHHSGEIAP